MSCGHIAMQKAGVKIDRYVAYEIDKYAVQTSKHNFPDIEQMGDVFHADFTQYEGFDAVIGGSPCTYWSIAQKNNRETEASGMGWELFSQYVRALHEAKPKFFIYENNKSMSKQIRASIDEAFGFEAVCINSALVSAQNRQRLYWVGKRNEDGTYSKVPVEQPEDLGIRLRDILVSGVDLTSNDKGYCLTASYDGACAWNTIERSQRTMVAEPVSVRCRGRDGIGKWEARSDGKNGVVTANTVGINIAEPVKVGEVGNGGQGNRIYSVEGKTYPVYEVEDGLITIKGKQYPIKLTDGFYIIRKLTVRECMRLQTVPEWYEFPVSDSQAYKMLGNGWTVDVIVHLIKSCLEVS